MTFTNEAQFADIHEIKDRAGYERAFPVMKELRTHIDMDMFTSVIEAAHSEGGYRLVAIERGDQILALMGYRILTDFVHGRHLYVDDLVTTKDHRSAGHGARLLKYAEARARELDCVGLRLCTGIENEAGKRFYEREGWALRAVAFKKKLAAK